MHPFFNNPRFLGLFMIACQIVNLSLYFNHGFEEEDAHIKQIKSINLVMSIIGNYKLHKNITSC